MANPTLYIVPTHVGVNRHIDWHPQAGWIVPTHVGVNRYMGNLDGIVSNCPHARGGEPELGYGDQGVSRLSPRTWG